MRTAWRRCLSHQFLPDRSKSPPTEPIVSLSVNFRSRSRILLLASGGTGCCRAGIDYVLFSSSCRGSELANRDYLYQLFPGGGDLPNRFSFRLWKSTDGLVCGAGNGCQPDRRFFRQGGPFTRKPTWS